MFYMFNKLFITILILIISLQNVYAEINKNILSDNLSKHFTKEDAKFYINPLFSSLSLCLNSTLYETAQSHDFLGFDIKIKSTFNFPDSSNEYFMPSGRSIDDPLKNDQRVDAYGFTYTPTAVKKGPGGESQYLPRSSYEDPDFSYLKKLNYPSGFDPGLSLLQFNFGLSYGSELMLRFYPELFNDGLLYGVGIKNNLFETLDSRAHLSSLISYQVLDLDVIKLNSSSFDLHFSYRMGIVFGWILPTYYFGLSYSMSKMDVYYTIEQSNNPEEYNFTLPGSGTPVKFNFKSNEVIFKYGVNLRIPYLPAHCSLEYASVFIEKPSVNIGFTCGVSGNL